MNIEKLNYLRRQTAINLAIVVDKNPNTFLNTAEDILYFLNFGVVLNKNLETMMKSGFIMHADGPNPYLNYNTIQNDRG